MSQLSPAKRVGIVHVHTDFSHDGRDSLEHLHAVCVERGIGFVGLTDHAEDLDVVLFDQYRAECERLSDSSVSLIPGLEFRFPGYRGLHLLAFGLTKWIEPGSPEEFVSLTADASGFTMLAHPLLCRYRIPRVVEEGIDAVEVWNASYNTRYLPDPKAIAVLHRIRRRRPNTVGVAGLDQHDSRNDRAARVVIDGAEPDPIEALRRGRFTNQGRTMTFDSAVSWSSGRLAALRVGRLFYDRVERTQEWVSRRWKRRR